LVLFNYIVDCAMERYKRRVGKSKKQ